MYIHKTAAEGAEDENLFSESHLETPNELNGDPPQSNLNDKANDFDCNPSNILKHVRLSRLTYGRRLGKPTMAPEPSNVAQG